ncbi:MAG: DUF6088 family protein [bacterium]
MSDKSKNIQLTVNKVKFTIYGHDRGWCMTPIEFKAAGSDTGVRYALHSLCKKGMIRRLAKGLYDYPVIDDDLGMMPPDLDKVAKALARKNKTRIQPSGAYAANLIGLSEQVPAKIVFVTDGYSNKLKIGNRDLIFKKATPKTMVLADTEAGLIVSGLKHIGQKYITPQMEYALKGHLKKLPNKDINKIHQHAPAWIRNLVDKLQAHIKRILIIGDVHGHLDQLVKLTKKDSYDFILQTGDFGIYLPTSNLSAIPAHRRDDLGNFKDYFELQKPLPVPTYFCKGNHEDFEFFENYDSQKQIIPSLFYIPNGEVINIQGVNIAFLGGNFSAKWFDKPVPKYCQNQKIRGYIRKDEIDRLKQYKEQIDILITHEPSTCLNFSGPKKYGCGIIDDLIKDIKPKYVFSGHIHKYAEGVIGETQCISLGAINYKDQSVFELSFDQKS